MRRFSFITTLLLLLVISTTIISAVTINKKKGKNSKHSKTDDDTVHVDDLADDNDEINDPPLPSERRKTGPEQALENFYKAMQTDKYFFKGVPEHDDGPSNNKDFRFAPNDLSNMPKDTEVTNAERKTRTQNVLKWIKEYSAGIEDELRVSLEYFENQKEKEEPASSGDEEKEKAEETPVVKKAVLRSIPSASGGSANTNKNNNGTTAATEPPSFSQLRIHTKQLLHPETLFLPLSMHLSIDLRNLCGDLNEEKNATEFCEAAHFAISHRRSRFFPEYSEKYYDADIMAPMMDQRMILSLYLSYLKFMDPAKKEELMNDEKQKHALFPLPYIEAMKNQPKLPVCSFTPTDLEFFPYDNQVIRFRKYAYEMYDYLIHHILPRFPNLFGKSMKWTKVGDVKRQIKEVFTFDRFAWAYCQTVYRARNVPGLGKLGFLPPIDLLPHRRTRMELTPSHSAEMRVIALKSKNYIDRGEEIVFSHYDRHSKDPSYILDRGEYDKDDGIECALVELPTNKTSDPLANDCLFELMIMFSSQGLHYSRLDLKVIHEACIDPRDIKYMVRRIEQLNVYNKSACNVDGFHREKYSKRTPQTKFYASQYLSLIFRSQLRKLSGKLGRMETLMRKRREGTFTTDEDREKLDQSPNFDLIYRVATRQKRILSRVQTELSTMMKESKPEFERWKENLQKLEKEKEDAELIRKGLKMLDEQEEEDDDDGMDTEDED